MARTLQLSLQLLTSVGNPAPVTLPTARGRQIVQHMALLSVMCTLLPSLTLAQPAPQTRQALEDIAAAATTHALSLLETGDYVDISASAQPMDSRLRLRRCELPLEAGSTAAGPVKPGRVAISVRCNGAAPWSLFVPVLITARAPVLMLKGPLPRGTVITAQHLELRELPVEGLPPHYLSHAQDVIGHELNRTIHNDSYATAAMLKLRRLVEKNQEVVIVARSGSLEVKMAGVALAPAQQGDRISVRNTASGRTVQGQVTAGGTVVVNL